MPSRPNGDRRESSISSTQRNSSCQNRLGLLGPEAHFIGKKGRLMLRRPASARGPRGARATLRIVPQWARTIVSKACRNPTGIRGTSKNAGPDSN